MIPSEAKNAVLCNSHVINASLSRIGEFLLFLSVAPEAPLAYIGNVSRTNS
jgi:hypothetical protein